MKTVYVESVFGEDNANNIALHIVNPTDEEPIPCYNEENNITPIRTRRIVKIEIDDNGIVKRFIEKGFDPQSQKGLRVSGSEEDEAVIGEHFPITT